MDTVFDAGWEVFANVRAQLLAMGEEERLKNEFNEMMNYVNQECEFDK
jgi:hypothetical protein